MGPEEHTTTRRERKKLATRDALRNAALELMGERGFDGVTVEEICEQADVASSTFFRHFATKEDVVLADFDARGLELLDALDAQPSGVTPTELLLGTLQVWRLGRRPGEVLAAEASLVVAEPALQARLDRMLIGWEDPIARRLAERYGMLEGALEIRLGAGWFVTTVRIVIREWALGGSGPPGEGEDVYTVGARAIEQLGALLSNLLPRS